MRIRTALALALMLALAGCGAPAGTDGVATANGTPSAAASPTARGDLDREAPVKFAQCMREHGMTWFKDPDPNAGGLNINIPPGQDKTKVDAAMAACKQFAPNGGEPPKLDPQMLENMRKMAQCMREHGIANFPDPKPDGSIQLDGDKLGTGPGQPKFDAAQKICDQFMPKPSGGVQKGTVTG
jgi:hypothetical protein